MKGIKITGYFGSGKDHFFPDATSWTVSRSGRLDLFQNSDLILQVGPGSWSSVGWINNSETDEME